MTRTKSMTHFLAYGEGMIELETKARGLAEELFLGLCDLVHENEGKLGADLLAEFNKSLIDLENTCKNKLIASTGDESATFGKCISGYKVRCSELRKGIKAGLDPTKYESFSKFRKAIDSKTGGNSVGSNGGSGKVKDKNSSHNKAEDDGKLHSVTNKHVEKLDSTVQDKLNLLVKHLSMLDKEGQLKVIADCDSAIHKLSKVGGRYSNVKSATTA